MITKEALITYVNLNGEVEKDFNYTILRGTESSTLTLFSGYNIIHVERIDGNQTFNRIFGVILLNPKEIGIVLTRSN